MPLEKRPFWCVGNLRVIGRVGVRPGFRNGVGVAELADALD